jgi:hypothetical protein
MKVLPTLLERWICVDTHGVASLNETHQPVSVGGHYEQLSVNL